MQFKTFVILLIKSLFSKTYVFILIKLVALITLSHLLLTILNNKILQINQAEETLLLIESKWNYFIEQCEDISNAVGHKIINSINIQNNAANLALFLNYIQYWSMFSEKNSIFRSSNLIWFYNTMEPIGALGRLDPNIFKDNVSFVGTCKNTPNKLILSKPYRNTFYDSLELHIETCKSFYKEGVYLGSLVIHISTDIMRSTVFENIDKIEYPLNTITIGDHDGNLITSSNEGLININEQMKSIKQSSKWLSKFYNNLLYKRTEDLHYILLDKSQEPLFRLKNFKFIPHIIIMLFFILGLINFIRNIIFYYNKNFIKLIFKLTNKFCCHNKRKQPSGTLDAIQFFYWLKHLFKNINFKLEEADQLKTALKELDTKYKTLRLEHKQTTNAKESLKTAYRNNLKIKHSIGEQLKCMLLKVITNLEEQIRSCQSLDILPSNIVAEIADTASKNLKDIFNLKIYSKKALVDPILLVDDTIKSLMLLAFLKEVTITSSIGNNLIPIYIDQLKFQLVITGLISQAVDLTHKGGNIDVKLKKVTNNNNDFFEIIIIDDSYASNFSSFSQNCFLMYSSITMSNIVQLIEAEGGQITIAHNSNYGKTITIIYPYLTTTNETVINYDNVYNLR